ncbi:Uncharacterized protein PECH_007496 [Penicillium ucsense]|uniref:SnoaL-like domain-containing protein n=1 Tax=Penicillium ucsense TaxID=2839758 RepID=A0A8J8W8H1_9EURO|nr:Uncharacterized protein PECM_004392 [Penicillium ucsense]KAF7738796.1 Uncharacterized protein PECH_007496 [Penicillium ucsense]
MSSQPPSTSSTSSSLLQPIRTFLQALTSPPTTPTYIPTLLSAFTTDPLPLIHEHGLPQLAPFLGRSFTGTDGIARYFQLLAEHLTIRDMSFEPETAWVADAEAGAVVVRGKARFIWNGTGQGWDEEFVYRLGVATEMDRGEGEDGDAGGGELKVCEYRIWADTGAAYLARLGKLGDLLEGGTGGGVERIHFDQDEDGEGERKKMEGRGETRASLNRKRSGHQDMLGAGLNVYGSCG